MRVLVTGASGFTGRHMVDYLVSLPGVRPEIFGMSRSPPPGAGTRWVQADLTDGASVARVVRDVLPDLVIHLAGLNRGSLRRLLEVNVIGTEQLLDAVLHEAPDARVLVVGSSAEYGYAGEAPIPENAPLRPVGPYGISKAAEDLLARRYHAVHDLSVAVAVPFNLVGPGLDESFVSSRIISQALEIVRGARSAIDLQGLDSKRDFVDVRDAVAAYWQILTADGFGEHIAGEKLNIGSGTVHSIAEVVDLVQRFLGAGFEIDLPAVCPPDPVPTQTADISRIRSLVGWSPRVPLEASIRDMIACAQAG